MLWASARYPPLRAVRHVPNRMFRMCTPSLSMPSQTLFRFVWRPYARILRVPGEIEIEEWKCLAELIDTAFDDFTRAWFHYFRGGRATVSILTVRQHRLRPELNAFAIAVAACPLLALLLSVELLNRALKRHRFQAATFHSFRILP